MTIDFSTPEAVKEALDTGVQTATFLEEMYSRMGNEMRTLPYVVMALTVEVRRLRAENKRLTDELATKSI